MFPLIDSHRRRPAHRGGPRTIGGFALALGFAAALTALTPPASAGVRGYNVTGAPAVPENDFKLMAQRGATIVRLSCATHPLANYNPDTAQYTLNWANLNGLIKRLDYCAKYDLKAIVDPHAVFGSSSRYTLAANSRFWRERKHSNAWVVFLRDLANRLKTRGPELWGYSLINEPASLDSRSGNQRNVDINEVYQRCVRAVRGADPNRNLILNFAEDDYRIRYPKTTTYFLASGDRGQRSINRIYFDNHCYWPLEFTHQGVNDTFRRTNIRWPIPKSGNTNRKDDNGLKQRLNWFTQWAANPDGKPNTNDRVPNWRLFMCEFGVTSNTNLAWNSNSFRPSNGGDDWMSTVYTWLHNKDMNFTVHSWNGNEDFRVRTYSRMDTFIERMIRGRAPNRLRD